MHYPDIVLSSPLFALHGAGDAVRPRLNTTLRLKVTDKAATKATDWGKRIAAKRRRMHIKAMCFAFLVPFRGYFVVFHPADSSVSSTGPLSDDLSVAAGRGAEPRSGDGRQRSNPSGADRRAAAELYQNFTKPLPDFTQS